MIAATREAEIIRRRPLSAHEREKLLSPYLPPPGVTSSPSRSPSPSPSKLKGARKPSKFLTRRRRPSVRAFVANLLHIILFHVIHTFFSLYIRIRQTYHAIVNRIFAILYYHHRTPELIRRDVKGLKRLPGHLSVILSLEGGEGQRGVEDLMDEVAEIMAWASCAGISLVSVYERTGILKSYTPTLHRMTTKTLSLYYGRALPHLTITAPHTSPYPSPPPKPTTTTSSTNPPTPQVELRLLSSTDSTPTLCDLTRTLTEMSQHGKLSASDITTDLINAEIKDSVCSEPDLLILFGPTVCLDGYPCWSVRLTEIFHVQDNEGVGYQVFLRALHRFAKSEMRFGR